MKTEGREVRSDISSDIMAKHGGRWHALPPHKKARFEDRVHAARREAQESADRRIDVLYADIEALKQELASDSSTSRPTRMSDCRLSDEDLVELRTLHASPRFSLANVAEEVSKRASPFRAPPAVLGKALASIEVTEVKAKHALPEWARFAAWHRSVFAKAIFQIDEPSGQTYWRFCYAKQSPH